MTFAAPYHERLGVELGVIQSMGFPGYFLIVADFIRWARDNEIPVGPGRGSGPVERQREQKVAYFSMEVGLETDMGRLLRAGRSALVLAIAGFCVPFLLGFGICYYTFDLPLLVSLFVGGTLTATSIGVTVRILADLGRQPGCAVRRRAHAAVGRARARALRRNG